MVNTYLNSPIASNLTYKPFGPLVGMDTAAVAISGSSTRRLKMINDTNAKFDYFGLAHVRRGVVLGRGCNGAK